MNKSKRQIAIENARRLHNKYVGVVALYGRREATQKYYRTVSPIKFNELSGIKPSVTVYNRLHIY